MKTLYCTLLIFFSFETYSQFSLSELITVYSMNQDQFESFALKKGYSFYKVENDDNFSSVSYVKGKGKNTQFIQLYTKYINRNKHVSFQTGLEENYLRLKNQVLNSGFKLIKTEEYKGSLRKTYKKDSWIFITYSISENNITDYEINLYKE